MNSTLFVQGDITTSGSVVAQQFRTEFVSESIIFASGSTRFGDSSDDKHRYTGSIEITGSNVIFSSGSKLGIGKTPTTVFEIESPDPKIKLGHSEENSNLNIFVNDNTGTVLQNTQEGARGRIDLRGYGSGSGASTYITARETSLDSGRIGVGIGIATPRVELQVEGAISSSGNVDVVSISGSKLTTIKGDNLTSVSGSITSTASFGKIFGDGSDLSNLPESFTSDLISGSYLGLLSGSDDLTLGGGVSGSITSTGSFGKLLGDASELSNLPESFTSAMISGSFQGGGSTNISGSLISTASFGTLELVNSHGFVLSTETGSFASGSDLQVILAESASYVVSTNTGSFASGSDVSQIQALTSSFLQNSDTASLQSTIITSSLEITGSQTFEGTDNFINFKSEYSGSKIKKWEMGKNSDDDFKINRYGGSGSFLDQPFTIASSSGITTINDQLTKSGGVTRLISGGSTTDGVSVYNDKKVGIGTGTTAIGDEKFLVAGDTGITGSLFVSSSITTENSIITSEILNNSGTLKVSQSVSDADIEISVNDGGTTTKALIIDGSDAGTFILGNNLRMADSQKIRLGTANDFNLYHDGSNTYVENDTGHILMRNKSHGSKIHFGTENSDGVLEYVLNVTGTHTVGIGTSITGDDKLLVMGNVGVTGSLSVSSSIKSITGNYTGNVSGALGNTGSFDRLEGITLNASISPFASGSDVSQIQAQTGSYATGSDLHQFLAESASYLVNTDTGSLGLLTLGNNITGSITSTASFGSIHTAGDVGIGTTSPVSALHIRKDSAADQLRLGRVDDNSYLSIGAGATHAVYNMVTAGTISHQFQEDGSAKMTITTAGGVGIGSTTPNDDKLLVAGNAGITGDLNVSGSITANEYIVNSSVTNVTQSFSSGSTIFGDSTDDTHEFSGSVQITGSQSVVGDLEISSSIPSLYFVDTDTPITNGIQNYNGAMRLFTDKEASHGGSNISFRIDGAGDSNEVARFINKGLVINVGSQGTTAMDENFLVNGDAGITGSLNVSGSITSNQTPNVHSLSGSLHVSGGAGGVLHLSSSVADEPMIQFHQSASTAAVLLQTDEYGAGLWHVKEYSGANHNGHLIGQTFTTSTQDAIRIRGGGNGDNNVDHYLGQSSYMLTDLGDVTTAHAKIDSSGLTTSGSVTASNGATIGNTETGSFTLSELNVIGTGIGLSLGSTNGIAGLRLRDNRASNNGVVAQRSDGRLSIASTENSYGVTGIEILPTGRVAVGNTGFGRDDSSLIEHMKIHGSVGITGSLHTSGSITTQANISGSITSTGSFGSLVVNGNVDMPDSAILTLGNSADIQLVHNGTDNFIQTFGAGDLYIRNNADDKDILFQSDDDSGGVKTYLQLDGSEGNVRIPDSVELNLGNGQDFRMVHDGSNTYLKNYTGTLFISSLGTNGDIIFKVDQGGVDQRLMVLDGSRDAVAIGKRADAGTLDPGDDKLLVAGDVGVTGSLFVSSSITTQGDIRIPATNKLYFDGGTHTYIHEGIDDRLDFIVGSDNLLQLNEASNIVNVPQSQFIVSASYGWFKNSMGGSTDNVEVIRLGAMIDSPNNPLAKFFVDDAQDRLEYNILRYHGKHTFTRGSAAGGHVKMAEIFGDSHTKFEMYHQSNNVTGGSATGSRVIQLFASTGSSAQSYIRSGGGLAIETGSVIIGGTSATNSKLNVKSEGSSESTLRIDADDARGASRYALHIVDDDSNSRGSVFVSTTSGPSLIVNGDVTGSIETTASFGRMEVDSLNLTTLSEVSGGLGSTGSFGQLIIQKEGSSGMSHGSYNFRNTAIFEGSNASGATIAISAKNTGYSGIFFGDQDSSTQGQLQFDHTTNSFKFVEGGVVMMQIDTSGNTSLPQGNLNITGSINVSGSVLPVGDNSAVQDIGSSSKRWNDVFAVQTTVGAVFETGLRSKGIGKEETGTIVVWRNGKLVPCDKSEDTMVMGVVKQGKDEPIVMGAEPVLVTGDVKEGDFITTSTKQGHGKKLENGYLLKKEMFGKVIAQALENASGNSSLIKCMIRKM
jgi:hypothetical protein